METSNELVEGVRSFGAAYGWLRKSLVDRDVEIRLALICIASRQHLFLLGPPGTGKSYLARLVGRTLGPEAPFFELLLTRFTDPSEVFGPISVKRLVAAEQYVRKTEGYLPEAHCAFLDEIWKASSAILNSLLTIVNERVYDNGGRRTEVPLKTLFSAANELPQDESLAALYDRFLVRREVRPVQNPLQLIDRETEDEPPTLAHLDVVQQACRKVALPDDVKRGMLAVKTRLQAEEQICVGDRRFQLSASLVRGASILDGRTKASPVDLTVLAHAWWQTPDQFMAVSRVVYEEVQKIEAARRPQPAPPSPTPPQPAAGRANGQNGPPRRPVNFPLPQGAPRPQGASNGVHWTKAIQQIWAIPEAQLSRNQAAQQLIHDCIVAPEAMDPSNRDAVLKLTTIKQKLINHQTWVGPTW